MHQLISNWEKLICNTVASSDDETDKLRFGIVDHDLMPRRRMTIPSMHVPKLDIHHHVVTLDPIYGKSLVKADLDDLSQPENGVTGDPEVTASDTESEGSGKEEDNEQVQETPYAANENEVLGSVCFFLLFNVPFFCLIYIGDKIMINL